MVKFNLERFKTKKWHIFLFLGLLSMSFGFSQEIVVKGTVLSSTDNMPLPGANVSVAGTNIGTATDFDGNYEITVSPNAQLSFSYIGFITQTISVNGETTINATLSEDLNDLEEVIVIGYGVQKKSLNTGANLNVKGEDLTRLSTTNALQALQGQVPGAQITSTSGQPGEGLRVVIRGIGSTGNNSPLYVVDGVLTGDINYLNNSDIESISILKDAASAAIYGSQASNGVVLVTTKKGTRNKSGTITFDQYYGFQNVPNKIDMLNSKEYATIMNEAAINSGRSPYFTNQEISAMGEGSDWIDEMIEDNTLTQNYSLGASGGSENSIYSTSLSYLSDEGIIGGEKFSNYERYNFRINTEHNLYKDLVTIGQNLNFAYTKRNGIAVGNQYNNTLRDAFNTSPFVPMYDENGDFYNNSESTWNNGEANPYAAMYYNNQSEDDNQKLIGNVFLEIAPFKGLTFRTSYGIDYYAGESHSYTPEYELSIYSFNEINRASQSMNKGKTLIWDNLLTYEFDIAENHFFEVMAGTSSYQFSGTSMYTRNSNLLLEGLQYGWIDNTRNRDDAAFINIEGGPEYENKRLSYFGRMSYNFKEKYLLNATFRADGSSQFAKNNRWGYYPSVSVGWVLTKEDFLDDSDWVNFFKLRASWGQVGNQNAGNLQYLAPIATDVNYSFGNEEGTLIPGAYPSRLANPGLKWETSEQINIGLDAVFLSNKLSVNVDWYEKSNKDWLIKAPIYATAGAEAPWINGGDVINRGIELALNFNDNIGDFNYSIGLNGSYNENEVGNIPTEDGIIHGETNQLFNNSPEFYRAEEGMPLGYFWGLETDGIFQTQEQVNNYTRSGTMIQPTAQPGDVIYRDNNNDGIISDLDKTMVGDPNPDFIYGLTLGFNYKALDFSVLANGVAGNQIVQSYRNQSSRFSNYTTAIFDRWHGEGSSNSMPRVTENNSNWTQFSDLFVQDGDYLRISNVTIGFDIAKLNVSDNFFASQLRIYFSALNLHTFTKYNGMDPEVGFGISDDDFNFSSGVDLGYYPRPRTFLIGLNVKL